MKQFNIIITLLSLVFVFTHCIDDGIHYESEINVPKGIYITGDASQFSVEAVKGKMNEIKPDTLYYINTWLKSTGDFKISLVSENGQPVQYGKGSPLTNSNTDIQSYSLNEAATGFTVSKEGLYQVVLNPLLKEVTIVPYNFKIAGNLQMNESGEKTIPFEEISYDNLNHIVTWKTKSDKQKLLASSYRLLYTTNETFLVKETTSSDYTFESSFTGSAGNLRTNVLTSEYTELNNISNIDLNLSRPGNYTLTLQYKVLEKKFYAKIEGEEIIEPEPEGYPGTLYMTGDEFGNWNWNSADVINMIPVGKIGNGAFWTIKYFTAGKGVKWSVSRSDVDSFGTLGSNVDYTINASGQAVIQTSGLYLVYVDLHRKLIAFEKPIVYGIGSNFNESETTFDLVDDQFVKSTQSKGNLRMFASSNYNDRDWTTMEFNIYNGKIVYRGTNHEQEIVPVAAGIPIELNFKNDTGSINVPLTKGDVPSTATALYLIGDEFGNMNWGSPLVESFERSYVEAYRWFYINYFEAGTGVRFSTSKVFGAAGEFVTLNNNIGFTVVNNKAMIPASGLYMIYVDLGSRTVAIERLELYAYGTAVGNNNDRAKLFDESADGKTVSVTLSADGRLRLHPYIPLFSTTMSPTFASWKREIALNPVTLDIFYRTPGTNEPNNTFVWNAGSKITLDFRAKKGTINK